MLVLTAAALYTPLETIQQPLVVIEDGKILEVQSRAESGVPVTAKHIDFGDCVLTPGLLDVHIHGSAGHDVMQDDDRGRSRMEEFLARRGVTSYLPTTVAAPMETTLRALERMADGIESAKQNAGRAQPLGVHLEGPF